MRSFNDFFFAIGVALLGGGLVFFTFLVPLHSLFAALAIWALSELLVARMRLVLPGILLACFFVIFVVLASPIDFLFAGVAQRPSDFAALQEWYVTPRYEGAHAGGPLLLLQHLGLVAMAYAGAGGRGSLFYARFRLPFALLLVAGGLVLDHARRDLWADVAEPGASIPAGRTAAVRPCFLHRSYGVRHVRSRTADTTRRLRVLAASPRGTADRAFAYFVWPVEPGTSSRIALTLTNEVAIAIVLMVAILAIVAIVDRPARLARLDAGLFRHRNRLRNYRNDRSRRGADNTVIFFATLADARCIRGRARRRLATAAPRLPATAFARHRRRLPPRSKPRMTPAHEFHPMTRDDCR